MAINFAPLGPDDFSGNKNEFPPIPEALLLPDTDASTPENPWVDGWRRNAKGSWEFRFMMDGERYEEDTFLKDKRKAKDFLLMYKSGILQRKKLGLRPTPTFGLFKQEYLAALVAAGSTPTHVTTTTYIINRYLGKLDGLLLSEITDSVVDATLTAFVRAPRLNSKGKPRMNRDRKTGLLSIGNHNQGGKKRVAAVLNAMIRLALARRCLLVMPYEPRKFNVDEIEWTVLDRSQVGPFLNLLSTIHSRDYAWEQYQVAVAAHMMLLLGLRESETTNASWHQVSWGRNLFIPTDTKNFKVQPLPMGARMRQFLEAYWVKCGKPSKGPMFPMLPRPTEFGMDIPKDRKHPKSWTYRTVVKAGEALGLTGLSPHRLRNTFATLHFEMGTDLLTLRKLLRHHSLSTTEKYIQRTSSKAMNDQIRYEEWIGLEPPSELGSEPFGAAKPRKAIDLD